MTPEAVRSLRGLKQVELTHFPFRIGRESRQSKPAAGELVELRLGVAPELNDLYLIEARWSDLLQISREHLQIEQQGQQFFVVDRGSHCGTIVAGKAIGGDRSAGRAEVRNGDLIVVGNDGSEYIFRFDVS
jgi:pSer/pThr/pTyr-binding forkhead associated (FHA) protein